MERAARMAIAVAGALALAGAGAGEARAGEVVAQLRGPVLAAASQGDATVLVRRPVGRRAVVERIGPDGTRSLLLRLPELDEGYALEASLAASGAAVVVGVGPSSDGFPEVGTSPSLTYVLPTGGSARRVASCEQAVGAPAVAAAGERVGYVQGGCAGEQDVAASLKTDATAVVEPASGTGATRARWALGRVRATSLALTADGALASTQDDRREDADPGELRRLGAGGAVARVANAGFGPRVLGALADGRALLTQGPGPGFDERRCDRELALVSAGRAASLDLGTCLAELDAFPQLAVYGGDLPPELSSVEPLDPPAAAVAGDRIATIQQSPVGVGDEVVSVAADGGDRRRLEAGSTRPPLLVAGGPGRVAWTRLGCDARTELVVAATTAAPTTQAPPACRLAVRTRRAAVRPGRRVAVEVTCARGCAGVLQDRDAKLTRSTRPFVLGPGRHRLLVRVSRCAVRHGRLRLRFALVDGREVERAVRLRTRPS